MERTENSQHNTKMEEQIWELPLSDFETYYKVTVINTLVFVNACCNFNYILKSENWVKPGVFRYQHLQSSRGFSFTIYKMGIKLVLTVFPLFKLSMYVFSGLSGETELFVYLTKNCLT